MNFKHEKNLKCRTRNQESDGFSLIETIIVIIIIGILLAFAIPKIGFVTSEKVSLDGASYMIASDIRYAQEFAMNSRVSKRIIFSTSTPTQYTFSPASQFDPSGRLPEGIYITKNLTIKFNSLGEPSFEVGDGSLTITGNQGTKTITIENYTGKVNLN